MTHRTAAPAPVPARRVVVMGVSGCGKTTIGDLVARELGVPFLDGDSLHPVENVAKMAAGTPLTDDDRWPWLATVGSTLANEGDVGLVLACSALRRGYRDAIRALAPGTVFLHLHGSKEVLGSRLEGRSGHFMPAGLLDSQLATLEPLDADEAGIVVDIAAPVHQVVAEALAGIAATAGPATPAGNAVGAAGTPSRQFDVDLQAAPFNLDDDAVAWVESTIAGMSLEEKIGQLFINHNNDYSPEYLDGILERYHVGGMRYRPGPSAAVQDHIRYAQSKTRIPLLVASNPEMGGAGSCDDGTFVSTHLQAGSHPDKAIARQMGQVAGVETAALGCNWAFAPIVDIHYNWRNTVISTRAFGNTPGIVVERAKEYFDGITESATVCAVKHFPGDGMDERDQHVVTSYNTLGYEEWNRTYGHVYREMIGHGVQSIMIGHIGAPELSRHFRPGLAEVHLFKTADQREAAGETGVNFMSIISEEATGDYADKYDAAFVFANVKGFAQESAIRIKWSTPMAAEIPWYVTEVPTVFVSLNQPNHLIDVPMVKTAIHAHAGTREAIRATIEKIQGKSEFQGTFNENVFCDSFDTRL